MTESGRPRKLDSKNFLAGTAAAAAGARGAGRRQLLAGRVGTRFAERRQEGDRHRNRRDGPAAFGTDDERGAAAQSREAPRPAAGSARWAPARRRRARLPGPTSSMGPGPGDHGIFDFIHRHPAGAVRPVLLGGRDVPGEGGVGGRRLPASARFLAVQPQAAGDGAQAAGNPVLGLPGRGGRPVDLLRPALKLPGEPVASRPPSLHLRHGNAGHAGNLWHLPALRRERAGRNRSTRRRGRKRSRLTFEGDTARARIVGPERRLLKNTATDQHRLARPSRPRRQRGRDRGAGPEDPPEGGPMEPLDEARLYAVTPSFVPGQRVGGICRFYRPGGRAELPALRFADQHGPGRARRSRSPSPTLSFRTLPGSWGRLQPPGFKEDYKARTNGVFGDDEYARQADMVLEERLALLDYAVEQLRRRAACSSTFPAATSSRTCSGGIPTSRTRSGPPARRKNISGMCGGFTRSSTPSVGDLVDRYGGRRRSS